MLLQADEIIITAAPDLANLRNAKNIVDLLKQSRHNDRPPHLVINMLNMPKRPEIPVKEFETALDLQAAAVIEFDSETFGQAANNGQMIEEMSTKAKSVQQFRDVAHGSERTQGTKGREEVGFSPASREIEDQALGDREMFGRRTSDPSTPPSRPLPQQQPAAAAPAPAKVQEAKPSAVSAPAAAAQRQEPVEPQRRHSEEYYDVKTTVFNALIDTIDLTQLAKLEADAAQRRDPRHRRRDHPAQKRRDVDCRAGGAARGHLQ